MKKFLLGILIAGGVLIVSFYLPQSLKAQQDVRLSSVEAQTDISKPPTPSAALPLTLLGTGGTGSEPIVFDMRYRSLSGGKDELRYNSYSGYGSPDKGETKFIKELKKNIKDLHTVYNPNLKKAEWSAVEIKDGKATAFYFDLNADGKVSDDEKILPSSRTERKLDITQPNGQPETVLAEEVEFVTPDFIMNTSNGRQVPFRVLLQGTFGKGIDSCSWSPSCVLEGTSAIAGEPVTLILFSDGSGSFTKYGQCSYYIQTGNEKLGQDVNGQTLSSLINLKGRYYHLKLEGSHEKDKTVRATLERYTGALGELAVKPAGDANLTSKLNSAYIAGSKDKTVFLNLSEGQSKLPVGTYKLSYAYINYGTENDIDRQLIFQEGPELKIAPDSTYTVEVGKPALFVKSIDEKNRYKTNPQEQTDFSKGTKIYISTQIKGASGEIFRRFAKKDPAKSGRFIDEGPTIKIVDSDGKEVSSAKMKYG